MKFAVVLVLLGLAVCVYSHMSIYVTSMWGQQRNDPNSNFMVNPLADMTFEEWWMHGPVALQDPPDRAAITQLPAGGTIDFEVATNKAFTTMGRGLWHSPGKSSRVPPDPWANTGSEWPSNLHAPQRSDVAGCALGIAYKSNVSAVLPEDFVIFSVAHDCPARALQAFDVPYLPACPNNLCICAWFWIHNSIGGTDQMYMTPFQCNVQNPSKRVIGKPVPAVRCDGQQPYPGGPTTTVCRKPLQPMYWKNEQRNNMDNPGHYAPIYSNYYGFYEGAQHQIFVDDFKCLGGSLGDTLFSNSNNTLYTNPPTLIASPSCMTKLSVGGDGNAALTDVNSGKVYWSTNTAGKGTAPFRLMLQMDGNLVLYDSKSTSLWSSGTVNAGCAPWNLKIRDQVHLTIVDCNGEPVWTAKTA